MQNFLLQGSEKLVALPKFGSLKYTDSGVYECVVTMLGLKKTQSFDLNVQGKFSVLFVYNLSECTFAF